MPMKLRASNTYVRRHRQQAGRSDEGSPGRDQFASIEQQLTASQAAIGRHFDDQQQDFENTTLGVGGSVHEHLKNPNGGTQEGLDCSARKGSSRS